MATSTYPLSTTASQMIVEVSVEGPFRPLTLSASTKEEIRQFLTCLKTPVASAHFKKRKLVLSAEKSWETYDDVKKSVTWDDGDRRTRYAYQILSYIARKDGWNIVSSSAVLDKYGNQCGNYVFSKFQEVKKEESAK